jgi:hypothetical protein
VTVSDIKVDESGRVYVLGALGSRESSTGEESTGVAKKLLEGKAALANLSEAMAKESGGNSKKQEAALDALLDRLEAKYFGLQSDGPSLKIRRSDRHENGKVDTQKLFVSRIGINGEFDETFGDKGTEIVHHVLEHREDAPSKLLLKPNGGIAFVARTTPSEKIKNWVVGHLNARGDLDVTKGKKGLQTIPQEDLPQGREWFPISISQNDDGSLIVMGHASVGEKDKFAEVILSAEGAEGGAKPITVRHENKKGERIEAMNLVAMDPKRAVTWLVAYDSEKSGKVSVKKFEAVEGGEKKMTERLTSKSNSLLEFKSVLAVNVNPDGSLHIIGRDDFNSKRVRGVTISPSGADVEPSPLLIDVYDSHASPYDNCISGLRKLVPEPYPLKRAA